MQLANVSYILQVYYEYEYINMNLELYIVKEFYLIIW